MAKILIGVLCLGFASAAPWPFSMWRSAQLEKTASVAASEAIGGPSLPVFYHTTKQMVEAVDQLKGSCPGLTVETVKDSNVEIQVVKYLEPGHTRKFATMLVANEHARELIGGEIALNFVKALCGQASAADMAEAKKDTEFLVVLNANPESRIKVERGQFCKRVNSNAVDINRNFDVDYSSADHDDENTNPGKKAFDQPESRIIKSLMEKFKPHAYLDAHSGFRGMFFPNAVANDDQLATQLQQVVAPVDESTCKCPLGVANKEIGYHTSGSALDYSFQVLQVPFSVAFEVYLDKNNIAEIQQLESRWETQKSQLLKPLKTGSSFMENGISPGTIIPMSFIQSESKVEQGNALSPAECLSYFNPVEKADFDQTVNSWTNAVASLSIKSREIHPDAAFNALKQKHPKLQRASSIQEETFGHDCPPVWLAVKVLGVLAVVYVAFKYYKVKQSKSAEAAPFATQSTPVQISD